MKNAFTLTELLIVISIVILLAIIALVAFNPKTQIDKAKDSKRKQELTQLSKVIEDYYNDKGCYPLPENICYNSSVGQATCNICGNDPNSPDFDPYLPSLPCDPQHPRVKYLYETDGKDCPSWYRVYTNLSYRSDPEIAQLGCSSGCGPEENRSYNYGVSSPNTKLQTSLNACLTYGSCADYCLSIGKTCSGTVAYESYSDPDCRNQLGICSGPNCCANNPVDEDIRSYLCHCQ
ncbi:type II secretion system protein [Patescibacteria group bacterium]|nr:type II secretion system protein [Patescibacteria group bacterium]